MGPPLQAGPIHPSREPPMNRAGGSALAPTTHFGRGEIRSLTGLRGCAAVMVMLYHFFSERARRNAAATDRPAQRISVRRPILRPERLRHGILADGTVRGRLSGSLPHCLSGRPTGSHLSALRVHHDRKLLPAGLGERPISTGLRSVGSWSSISCSFRPGAWPQVSKARLGRSAPNGPLTCYSRFFSA